MEIRVQGHYNPVFAMRKVNNRCVLRSGHSSFTDMLGISTLRTQKICR
ncbi:MAG: hypothetical protein RLZZ401_1665 [Pseudomonadota bacterium]